MVTEPGIAMGFRRRNGTLWPSLASPAIDCPRAAGRFGLSYNDDLRLSDQPWRRPTWPGVAELEKMPCLDEAADFSVLTYCFRCPKHRSRRHSAAAIEAAASAAMKDSCESAPKQDPAQNTSKSLKLSAKTREVGGPDRRRSGPHPKQNLFQCIEELRPIRGGVPLRC